MTDKKADYGSLDYSRPVKWSGGGLSPTEKAAITIQRVLRGVRARKRVGQAKSFKERSIQKIQSLRLITYIKAVATMIGLAIGWLGWWTLFDTGLLWASSFTRDALYLVTGLVLLLICDSFYANGGFDGSLFNPAPAWYARLIARVEDSDTVLDNIAVDAILLVKLFLGQIGSALVFWAIFDLIDQFWVQTGLNGWGISWKCPAGLYNLSLIVVGIILTCLSGAFFAVTGVELDEVESKLRAPVDRNSPFKEHLKLTVLTLTSLLGQSLLWVGGYNFLETDIPYKSVWREVSYVAVGFGAFFLSDSFISNGLVEDDGIKHSTSLDIYSRSLLSLLGAITHNTGLWVIFDVYVYKYWATCSVTGQSDDPFWTCRRKDALYILIGMLLLWFTSALQISAGMSITPVSCAPGIAQRRKKQLKATMRKRVLDAFLDALVRGTLIEGDDLYRKVAGKKEYFEATELKKIS